MSELNKDTGYVNKRQRIAREYLHSTPGEWGEFVRGIHEDVIAQGKVLALTFDACGGPKGSGFDSTLVNYLRKEKIRATFFVTGIWIDANYHAFLELAKDSLFEIENHGLYHRPCSIDGESEYGIKGTPNVQSAVDEMEANAIKIQRIIGKKPTFFRSATAFTDEACTKIAKQLGITMVSFDVLSGDAMPFAPADEIRKNVLKHARPGAIVIMHFNHPEWNTYESLLTLIPALRKQGYSFVRLRDQPLSGKKK